jgi:hypothetical protein
MKSTPEKKAAKPAMETTGYRLCEEQKLLLDELQKRLGLIQMYAGSMEYWAGNVLTYFWELRTLASAGNGMEAELEEIFHILNKWRVGIQEKSRDIRRLASIRIVTSKSDK